MNTKNVTYRVGWAATLLAIVLLVGACKDSTLYPNNGGGGGNNGNNDPVLTLPDIYGIEWHLQSIESPLTGNIVTIPDDEVITLTFQKDNLGGSTGCNAYGADYTTAANNALTITNIISTMVACGPGSHEGQFVAGLETTASYKVTNTTLLLYNADKSQVMRFSTQTKPIQLIGLERISFAASKPYSSTKAVIDGDILTVTVQYSGGCEDHNFLLYGPLTIPDNDPTKITTYLIHESKPDMCEAFINESRQFDLTPLKKRWQEVRGETAGEIEISIHDAHTGIIHNVLYKFGFVNDKTGGVVPQWLQDTIKAIESQPAGSPRVAIYQYTFNNATVYYRTAPCCDMFTDLYDENGNIICHPDGGFSGSGDGQCPTFLNARTNGVLVWKDSR